MQTQNINIHNQ